MFFNDEKLAFKNGDSSTLSVGDWFLFSLLGLLNLVPIAGTIAYVVLLVVIAVNKETAPTLKNFIVVLFIWLLVGLVVLAVMVLLLMLDVFQWQEALGHVQFV